MTTAFSRVPWIDWGGDGPLLHLAHANGFPPGSYRKLVAGLTGSFHVVSMSARPLWSEPQDPAAIHDWTTLADDLVLELERRGLSNLLGWGHSLGSVLSLLAAARRPGLFRAIVAVDPVIFTGPLAVLWRLMKRLGLARSAPIVKNTLRRREIWDSHEQIRAAFAKKAFFAHTDPECLDDYVRAGFLPTTTGKLAPCYSKAWEARIFAATPDNLWQPLEQLAIPVLFLRGQRSDTFSAAALEHVRRVVRHATCVEVPNTTHLLPFEQPQEVAARTVAFLGAHVGGDVHVPTPR
jgi:pimeloyl-ACP methyl ester carboxylesterase